MDGSVHRWMHGLCVTLNGCMDGWTDGWMGR